MEPVVSVVTSPNNLTYGQKLWIAHQLIDEHRAPVEVAKSIGLSRKVVTKYALRVKSGSKLHMRDGRPATIDDSTLLEIVRRVKNYDHIDTEIIKKIIREEYQSYATKSNKMTMRKGKLAPKLLCWRTLMRYVKKVQELATEDTEVVL